MTMEISELFDQLDDYIRGMDKEAHRLDDEAEGFRKAGNNHRASYYNGCGSAYRHIIGDLSLLVAVSRAECGIPVDPSWRDHIQYDDDDGQDPLKRGDYDEN